jgi:hypothetical protein
MFLNSIFISTEALLAILLVLFDFAVLFIFAMDFVMPKPMRSGFAVWEELIVPPLDVQVTSVKTTSTKTKRTRKTKRKKKR